MDCIHPRLAVPLFLMTLFAPAIARSSADLAPDLEYRMAHLRPNETVSVVLTFKDHADLDHMPHGRSAAPEIITTLQATAERSQARVHQYLREHGLGMKAQSFWINNSMVLEAPPEIIKALTAFSEVERIDSDVAGGIPDGEGWASGVRVTGWNMDMIRAPEIWSTFGLDGTGIVIGSLDSGCEVDHPALQGRWRGGANSWLDAVNNRPAPYDDHGHGTHTIGTMVGGDGPGPFPEDIGLAYNARLVVGKIIDSTGHFQTLAHPLAGAQWMLDPDGDSQTNDFPHVISNSWGFGLQTFDGFYAATQAWRAAGIIPVFAIGNAGPGPATTSPPGNYNNVIGVGATDNVDMITNFSSRGPSPAGFAFPANQRKPDLSAPGLDVISSFPGGGYFTWWGTSMATPHVTATVALMLQFYPALIYEETWGILTLSAVDRGSPGYDHDYGYGRLDAYEAISFINMQTGITATSPVATPHLRVAPNPFTQDVRIDLGPGMRGRARLEVFDPSGRLLCTIGHRAAGSLHWNGRDESGNDLPAGVYFLRITDGSGSVEQGQRLVKIR